MAKKTKTLIIEGKIAWAHHLFTPDEFKGKEFWKVTVYPDSENIQKLKDAGSQVRMKYDEGDKSGIEGKNFTFRRDTILFGEEAQAPKVTFQGGPLSEDVLVGNGSFARIKLDIYATKQFGNGTRLVAVDVLDLIEYVAPEDDDEEDEKVDEGSEESTKSEASKSTPAKKTKAVKADW